ncbi:3'-5' ssDNA/RNA exonuclease TatD [Candidatus Entotheonellaceae bacterium PAL068K]
MHSLRKRIGPLSFWTLSSRRPSLPPSVRAVCAQSQDAGVNIIVAAGTGLQSNRQILALQQRHPAHVWAALGLHPERTDTSWTELEAVTAQIRAHRSRVVALGEIGLPHDALLDQRMTQSQAQERQAFLHVLVQTAVQLGLAVVLHAPHAGGRGSRHRQAL